MHPNPTNPNAATQTNEYKLVNPNETNVKFLLKIFFFQFLEGLIGAVLGAVISFISEEPIKSR